MSTEEKVRIETELEVQAFLQNLQYSLEHGSIITFQEIRQVDKGRDIRYTNAFTVAELFPDEDPVDALRREVRLLQTEDYMRTVKDIRFPARSEMREFGKVYNGTDDVYIKLRVELLGMNGEHTVFIMSFHFAETAFSEEMFPYRKKVDA